MLNIPLQLRLWVVQLALLALLADAFVLWSLGIYAMLLLAKLPQLLSPQPQSLRPAWSLTLSNVMAVLIVVALLLFNLSGGVLHLMIHLLLLAAILRLLGFRHQDMADFRQLNWVHYFLIASCFILNQSLAMALLIFVLLLLQLSCHYLAFGAPGSRLPVKNALKLSLWFVPLWLGLFLLFPRVSPLWQLPMSQQAITGLGDELNPGSIEQLVESDALAFRVEFDGQRPESPDLYWRARIYDQFDGRSWRMSEQAEPALFDSVLAPPGLTMHYRLVAEPHQQRHLFSLGIPQQVPGELRVNTNALLSTRQPLRQRISFGLTSALLPVPLQSGFQYRWKTPDPTADPQQSAMKVALAPYLTLPDGNPKTRALAAELASQSSSPQMLVELIGRHLQQGYRYTLTPPLLTGQQIDQFLFESQAGFCSHYASATSFLLRAAGVPSRIVGGYLGGEWRDNASYLQVRQRDAHAWVEYLQDGQWRRFDPTLMVAPDRLNNSLDQLLSEAELLRLQGNWAQRMAWSKQLMQQLEDLDYYWSRWVLGFDTDRQQDLMSSLKQWLQQLQQLDWRFWLKSLMVIVVLPLLVVALRHWQQKRRQPIPVWLQQQLFPFARKAPQLTIQQFLKQLASLYPQANQEITAVDASYQRLIFGEDATALPLLKRQTKQLVHTLRRQA
jgi:transglutaminase-like putative cysteine protease